MDTPPISYYFKPLPISFTQTVMEWRQGMKQSNLALTSAVAGVHCALILEVQAYAWAGFTRHTAMYSHTRGPKFVIYGVLSATTAKETTTLA